MSSNKDIFFELKNKMGVELPKCVVDILKICGFTNRLLLENINSEAVDQIEQFCNQNRTLISEIMIGSIYENMQLFKFVPGHRLLILNLPKYCEENKKANCGIPNEFLPSDSTIMRAIKENAAVNFDRAEAGKRYNDISKFYAIYLYLMGGKALYESICANLPLPKAAGRQ